jgi:hypothetical protein
MGRPVVDMLADKHRRESKRSGFRRQCLVRLVFASIRPVLVAPNLFE